MRCLACCSFFHHVSAMDDGLAKLAKESAELIARGRAYAHGGDTMRARACFAKAAQDGSAEALCALALELLTQAPLEADKGVNMLRAAADRGDAEAALRCGVLAAGDEALADRWNVAQQCLRIAAERGSRNAQEQIDFLGDIWPSPEKPDMSPAFSSPRIFLVPACATGEECDWLIARARPHLRRAKVYDTIASGGRVESARTNSTCEFTLGIADVILMRMRARIAAAVPSTRLETTSVLHYAPGEAFVPHFDFLEPIGPAYARDLAENGQRVATFLIYLNDDYDGGETDFPNLGWRMKGRKGDGLLFWNVDEAGLPDRQSFHAGLPPVRGEKWLLSQWLRRMP